MTAPLSIYVRVSRRGDREDGKFRSPQEQEDRARQHAKAHGYAVGEVVPDINVSGAVHPRDRPGMSRILEDIEAGRSGGIVAYSLDRLSRDPSHGDDLVVQVTSHGGILTTPDMPADITTPTGEFQFGILLQVARLYRRTAGERFAIAAADAVRRGIPHGRLPFGYRQLEDRTIEPHPVEAPLVVRVFELRIQGKGWGHIGKWLARETGRSWSRRGVERIIARELYRTGHLKIGDVVSEVDSGVIVDEATWYAAQVPKMVRDGRTEKARAPLAGLLRCGSCGRVLVHWAPTPKSKQYGRTPRYRCSALDCEAKASIMAPLVEGLVVVESFAQDLRLVRQPQKAPDLAPLEEALTSAERRLAHALLPASQDDLADDWAPTVRQRREARDAAASALGVARSDAGVEVNDGRILNLGHVWPDLLPAVQREALLWLWEAVKVTKGARSMDGLEFVPRGTVPVGAVLEMSPAGIERVS